MTDLQDRPGFTGLADEVGDEEDQLQHQTDRDTHTYHEPHKLSTSQHMSLNGPFCVE